jgi:hypothetical protein
LGARLLLQSALEAEVTEFLGRSRYQRRALAEAARAGSRNGFSRLTVKTTAGPVTLERPACGWTSPTTRPRPYPTRPYGGSDSPAEAEDRRWSKSRSIDYLKPKRPIIDTHE